MRLIAISIVIFCGSLMACVGVIADGLSNPHELSYLAAFGVGVVLVAGLLFVIEWMPAETREKVTRAAEKLSK